MRTSLPVVTELDAARIRGLAANPGMEGLPTAEALRDWVASEVEVVAPERISPDVVTLGSSLSFRELESGAVHRVSVVHPVEASMAERRISVLSPVGRALLGRRVGDITTVHVPDGGERRIEVLAMHYQPEAAGVPVP